MASPSPSSPSGKHGSRSPESDRKKKLLSHLEFWKEKEKTSPSDLGSSPTTSSPLSSVPIPALVRSLPNYPSSNSFEGFNNNTRNNKSGTAPITTNNNNITNNTNNNTIPLSNTPPVRQEHTSLSNYYLGSGSNTPTRNQLSTSGNHTKVTNKQSTNIKSPSVDSVSSISPQTPPMHEPHKSPSTPIIFDTSKQSNLEHSSATNANYNKLISSDTQPAAMLANRRSSLSDRLFLGLNNRPTKPAASNLYTSDDEQAGFLIQKIQELEVRLNEVENQLRKETIKRIETTTKKDLEQSLKRGDKSEASGEASQQILKGLEEYKSLETQYRALIKEVAGYKQTLKEISQRLTSSKELEGPLELNSKKRVSTKISSNSIINPTDPDQPKPRKTNSFNEAISTLKRADLSRTSLKFFSSSNKRQSHKHSHSLSHSNSLDEHASSESDLTSDVATTEGSDDEGNDAPMHTELIKQLIQQKYANKENMSTPFINNLRSRWRHHVSKSDSWANKLQAGDWVKDSEDTETEGYLYGSGVTPGRDSHNFIGYSDEEDSTPRSTLREGGIVLPLKFSTPLARTKTLHTINDSANTSSYGEDSDDEGPSVTEGRKKLVNYTKIKNIFSRDKPVEQTDVGLLVSERLKRRPTYQQLVSKKIMRGDTVFGIHYENLRDIPLGIKMIADFIVDSDSLDILDSKASNDSVESLKRVVDNETISVADMELSPHAAGTLILQFFQQMPEKLLSYDLSTKFQWVYETEIATLRYSMFRSLTFVIGPHRNILAFLFKWLRKLSEDYKKSSYFTPAYLGTILGPLIMYGDASKAALATQRMIEDYKHVFLDAELDIRHFMKDGRQLVRWGTVDRLIEKLVDPNSSDDQLVPMFFFCHMYFVGTLELLEKIVGLYLKCKLGMVGLWKREICQRITNILKIWIINHGPALSMNDSFVSLIADFMKRRRESNDPDATEKQLDRTLFEYRSQQNLLKTLPFSRIQQQQQQQQQQQPVALGSPLSTSGGKNLKNLIIPATILEHNAAQVDYNTLPSSSAPTSPRSPFMDTYPSPRVLTQTTSAHFARNPPAPLIISTSGSATVKPQKSPTSKVPTTPLPFVTSPLSSNSSSTSNSSSSSSSTTAPVLVTHNRFSRAPLPSAFQSSSSSSPFNSISPSPPALSSSPPVFRAGTASRPRAVTNAYVGSSSGPSSNSNSPSSSPICSPRDHHSILPSSLSSGSISPISDSSLSAQIKPRSLSRATAPDFEMPEEKKDARKTIRYTTTYGAIRSGGSIPRSSHAPCLSDSLSSSPSPSPSTSLSLSSPISLTATSSTASIESEISSSLTDSTNSVMSSTSDMSPTATINNPNFINSTINSGFLIPKSLSIDSSLSNAEGSSSKPGRNRAYSTAHGRISSALPGSGPGGVDLVDVEPKVIAEHMAVIDHENFAAIPMSELLQKNYSDPKTSPNFTHMANKFNEWGSWTLKEILKRQDIYERASALSLFIEISKESLNLNNFNSCCAILGALNNSAIQRLKSTWEKVNKKTLAKYKKMMELFDLTYNSKNYREAIKNTKPPAVPYLALIPRDITSAEEIPTFVENGMCNLDKMRTLYKILCEVQNFQKETYPVKTFPEFLSRLKSIKDLYTDNEAYQRSLKIEPREIT